MTYNTEKGHTVKTLSRGNAWEERVKAKLRGTFFRQIERIEESQNLPTKITSTINLKRLFDSLVKVLFKSVVTFS